MSTTVSAPALFKPTPAPQTPKPTSRKRYATLGLGILLSIALPVLAFQGVNVSTSWDLAIHCDGRQLALGGYLALAAGGVHQAELIFAGQLALAGGACLTAMLFVGYWRRAWLQRLIAAPARWVKPSLGAKVETLAGRFLEGLQVFASPRQV